jgi:hypothetical protein
MLGYFKTQNYFLFSAPVERSRRYFFKPPSYKNSQHRYVIDPIMEDMFLRLF